MLINRVTRDDIVVKLQLIYYLLVHLQESIISKIRQISSWHHEVLEPHQGEVD